MDIIRDSIGSVLASATWEALTRAQDPKADVPETPWVVSGLSYRDGDAADGDHAEQDEDD